jgi:amidase
MTDAWLDATAQAALVRNGDASPSELVDDAIARVEALNPTLNAVIHERFDRARAEAAAELPDGPFRGVPFLVKDAVCHQAGEPNHHGMQVAKDAAYVAPDDTWLAERYRNAGFVTLGRTNVPELTSTITTEPVAYGPSRNPWNTERSTGGSSGGSAG